MAPQGYQQKNMHVIDIGSVARCSEQSEVRCAVDMSFSQEQRVFIVEHYFSSLSYARVVNEFCEKYPGDKVPNNSTITRLIALFRETGSVADKKKTGRPKILTDAKLGEVRDAIQRSPSKSLRRLSAQSQISYGSAQEAMKKLHMKD